MIDDVGLLSERQCIARNARRQETHKTKRRQHRLGVVSVQGRQVTSGVVSDDPSAAAACETPPVCHSPLQMLTDEHRDLISLLVAYQDKYDLPTEDDIRKVSVSPDMSVCLSVTHNIMSPTTVHVKFLNYQCQTLFRDDSVSDRPGNLEKLGNLTLVREKSWKLGKVVEIRKSRGN